MKEDNDLLRIQSIINRAELFTQLRLLDIVEEDIQLVKDYTDKELESIIKKICIKHIRRVLALDRELTVKKFFS